jgi:hypothetical protein
MTQAPRRRWLGHALALSVAMGFAPAPISNMSAAGAIFAPHHANSAAHQPEAPVASQTEAAPSQGTPALSPSPSPRAPSRPTNRS